MAVASVVVGSVMLIGTSVLQGLSTIIAEALVDTATDYVIDGVDEIMQKAMPNFDNQYVKQFTNQIRMGAATATNARIMGAALKSQNKFETKMDVLRQNSKTKYNQKKQNIENLTGFEKLGKSKALGKLRKNYDSEIERMDRSSDRYTAIRQSASNEANAFSSGTGNLKQGHDGTIQNLKGNPNADLVVSINRLLNGLGNYKDKEGVLNI